MSWDASDWGGHIVAAIVAHAVSVSLMAWLLRRRSFSGERVAGATILRYPPAWHMFAWGFLLLPNASRSCWMTHGPVGCSVRFPKFILGFLAASVAVTVVLGSVDSKIGTQYSKDAIGPLKTLRGWAFTWTFLSIGFTTRFRELTKFGWRPSAAFALGVLINVPLGYWLSTSVFASYWLAVK